MTYYKPKGKAGAIREWVLSDGGGAVIGIASSSWVMVDLNTRKLARIPPAMIELFSPYVVDGDVELPFRPDATGAVPEVTEAAAAVAQHHSLRTTDVDMNDHVTTVTYAAWVTSLPFAQFEGKRVEQIDIEFKNECRGDVPAVLALGAVEAGASNSVVCSLRGTESEPKPTEFARARIIFGDL